MIKYVSSLVFAAMFLFVGTAQAATITGSGFITTVGADFAVISDSTTGANTQVFYTPAVTTYLGGTTAPLKAWSAQYAVYTGTTNLDGSATATSFTVYPKVGFVLAPIAAQVGTAIADTNIMTTGTAPFVVSTYVVTAAQVAAANLPGTVESYNIPAGMTISAAGILSGTPTTAGVYTVGVYAKDSIGNSMTSSIYVEVSAAPVVVVPPADTTAPVITMNGSNVTLVAGTSYVDAGATCTDNVDSTCAVTTTSTVNSVVAGTYTVTYTATDAAGNVANPVVRTVTVNPAPVVVTPTPTPTPTPAPTTDYTSTGKKVEAKGVVATYDTVSNVMTLTNGVVLRITATTKVKLNGYILSAVGRSAQYKGIKNTDSSVTLTSIEVN